MITVKDLNETEKTIELPGWTNQMINDYQSKSAHMFLLHNNVNDYVFVPGAGQPLTLKSFLVQITKERFSTMVFYCQSGGIELPDEIMADSQLLGRYGLVDVEADEFTPGNLQGDAQAFEQLSDDTRRQLASMKSAAGQQQADQQRDPKAVLPSLEKMLMEERNVAVIIEYIDKLAPHGNSAPDILTMVETFQRWAWDPKIRANRNIVFLLTDNLPSVHPDLYSPFACKLINVNLPQYDQRRDFLAYLMEQSDGPALASEINVAGLARLTSSFTLRGINYLFNKAKAQSVELSHQLVRETKDEIIPGAIREGLEVIMPEHGFEVVGGYREPLDFFNLLKKKHGELVSEVNLQDREARRLCFPRGILLSGPPGTGKTMMAKCLAKALDMNFVVMKNVRSMWVGESERRLEQLLSVIVSLENVVVFVDEIDQAFPKRGLVADQSHEVEKHLFQMILDVMNDDNRGKILWVGTTNRPDMLDNALARRFDIKMPILLPTTEDRLHILRIHAARKGLSDQKIDWQEIAKQTDGMVGDELSVFLDSACFWINRTDITQSALLDKLGSFKQSRNELETELSMWVTLNASSSFDFIPDNLPEPYRQVVSRAKADSGGGQVLFLEQVERILGGGHLR